MIKNERQLQTTRAQVDKFERTLAELEMQLGADAHPPTALQAAERDALRSQIESLRREIDHFMPIAPSALESVEQAPPGEPMSLDEINEVVHEVRRDQGQRQAS